MKAEAKRIPKEGHGLPDIEIKVVEEGAILGEYFLAHYQPWNGWKGEKGSHHYGGKIMHSYRSNSHIPRLMMEKAVSEMQQIADSINLPIVHVMSLETLHSAKMDGLCRDCNYESKGGYFQRVFMPKTF